MCVCFFYFIFFFLNPGFKKLYLFSREREGVELVGWGAGEHLRGDGEGETVVRIYCMKIIFNSKKEKP